MKAIQYPPALKQKNIVAVTSPSAGISATLEQRLQCSIERVRQAGLDVELGKCLYSSDIVSATASARAQELTQMLCNPAIRAIVPPWGGELLINILPLLDFEMLAQQKPTWLVGYSDLSTLLMPYTMITGIATLHGANFMETAYNPPPELKHWIDIVTCSTSDSFSQLAATRFQTTFASFEKDPAVNEWNYTKPAEWKLLGSEDDKQKTLSVSGRLIGGCVEVISMLPGTKYGDVERFARDYAPEGLLVYLEICEVSAATTCRMLHHMKLAGWFKHARALLIGRTQAPDGSNLTQVDALRDALADLGIPVIYDMDIGHVPPQAILVNGALAQVQYGAGENSITQRLI